MTEIHQKGGLFDILTSSDRHIQHIFKLVTKAPSGQIVLENTQDREYLAITRLEGSNWYFVSVYPKALLSELAGDTARFILLLGGLSLLVEITVLFFVLQQQVAQPLKKLLQATEKVSAGNFDTQLNIARQDELGRLAYSFNTMAREVQTREMSLQQANRLKDEFLANTSHELRTPLNGIIGLAESLIDGATGELPPATRSNLAMIISSGRRLASLVNDILDFSKLRHKNLELQLKPVDLRSIADVVLTLSQPLVGGKDIQLVNAIPESLPPANADENRLQQIFHNLSGNAIKFTESGTVEVSAAMVERSGGNEADGDKEQLAITISDTGIGIPEDKFDRIFESFEQAEGSTAREYGGTGLGLAVTTQLVELHEGTIYVKSEVGKGSQFTVTLPIARRSAAQSRSVPAVSESQISISLATQNVTYRQDSIEGNKPTIKVLIVDDEPINRQVLINHLSVYGYTITQASNGLEAIALIEGGLKPDVVLLDVMMPKMTGYEVTKKLRERFPSTELPILLLTAKIQVQDIVMGLNIGANDYLAKPIAKDELMARIGTQINMRSLRTENLRMNAELDIAKQVQQMVLPKAEELQAIPGLEIAGFMAPADQVGGDYYDILYSDDIVTIGIGDVTGHGLESGILMVMAQTAVGTLKEIKQIDPVRFLDTLKRTIYKNWQRMNCDNNLTLAILNYAQGRMSISGQHEEIMVVRKGGKIKRIDTINLGFPIGLDDDIAHLISDELVELEPGDGVVLYTDGIPEARDIDRKFYGLERLCKVVAINWHLSAEQIKQAAIDDRRGFIGEQQVFDDITLVVLKRTEEKNAQSSEGSLAVPCN
jgi:signal transduction histidine kinase/serine phosphatase RsbU (regulator of sigma subunit)